MTLIDLTYTPHILPFAAAILVLALLLHIAWNNRRDPVAHWFALTLVSIIVWGTGYCFEIMATTLAGKIFFANIQFLGVATVSICWWEMVRRYLDLRRIPRVIPFFLWSVAAATIVLAFLNPGGVFRDIAFIVSDEAPFTVLHAGYGPWYYWVFMPVTFLLNVWSLLVLARAMVKAQRFYRHQFALLLVALSLPLLGTVYYFLRLPPWPDYNPTIILCGVSGISVAIGLTRWRLFNILPLAHDRVVENLIDGVIVIDREGRIIELNHAAERITRLSRSELFARPFEEALAEYPVLIEALKATRDKVSGAFRRDMVIKRDQVISHFSLNVSTITSHRDEILGCTLVMHDITERVRLLEQARDLANRDDLTGLPNRRHFFELAHKELSRARRYQKEVSLLLFDVDFFKDVNDVHGHRAGDRFLQSLARVCRRTLRDTDIIGRVGGEEFAVLLPETGLEDAVDAANRLREAVQTIHVVPSQESPTAPLSVTISVGVAEFVSPPEGPAETFDSVYERADRALYEAKASGRNAVVAAAQTPVLHTVS
jgi:diguanylate cyclase (GGDEF)-like protein/PAS domain S-box-containing protein